MTDGVFAVSSIGQKIKDLRSGAGLTREAFALALGEKPSKIQDVESGRQRVNDEFLRKLIDRFPVDLNWLFDAPGFVGRTGLVEPPDRTVPGHGDVRFDGRGYAFVRKMDLSVSAGTGVVAVDEAETGGVGLPTQWFARHGLNSDLCVLVRVRGDSMAPTIPDASHILIDLTQKRPTPAGVYAFGLDGEAFVKRLVPGDQDGSGRPTSVAIIADNPAYPPVLLTGARLGALRVVGRVRGVFTAL